MAEPALLFSQLSEAARYLIGRKNVQPDHWDCDICGCPVVRFSLEQGTRVRLSCASCGARGSWLPHDHPRLAQIAAEDQWDKTVEHYGHALGNWWLDTWIYEFWNRHSVH
jgi:hypothetical protein